VPAGALAELVEWARGRGLARLRVEPEAGPQLADGLRAAGFRRTQDIQPRHTLIVPLAADSELMASFKPKTRYNIRLALKKGVQVEEGTDAAELERQSRETSERQRIALPSRAYYEALLRELPFCRTYIARHEGEALAAVLVAHHAGRAYYLFGGATGHKRELMPAYAVQWAAMQAARQRGCVDYDLWGIPPSPDPSHPWHGLWQFKTGFGGEHVEYVGAWDLVLSPTKHTLLRAQEAVRDRVRRWRTGT
jgi:lipid II:glycine glycyltransferase (peptidoglycan interpeptide bridge formation enzyme)